MPFTGALSLRAKLLFLILGVACSLVVALIVIGLDAIDETGKTAKAVSGNALESQAKKYIAKVTEENAARNALILDQIMADASLLAVAVGQYFSKPEQYAEIGAISGPANLQRMSDGHHVDAADEQASIYIPNSVEVTEALEQQVLISRVFDPLALAALRRDSKAVAAYLVTIDDYSRYHPKGGLDLPPDILITNESFFTMAAPEANPERRGVWSPVYEDPAGHGLMVSAISPIYDDAGGFIGVTGIDFLLSAMGEAIETAALAEGGYSFLIDGTGRAIAFPDQAYGDFLRRARRDNEFGVQLNNLFGQRQDVISAMVNRETGVLRLDEAAEEKFIAYTPLGDGGWSLATVVPTVRILGDIQTLQAKLTENAAELAMQKIIPLSLVILLVVTLIASYLAHRLTIPLRQLTYAAAAIGQGDWDVDVPVHRGDEIGTLSHTLVDMAGHIKGLVSSLEQRVAERTSELSEALETAESAMLARTQFLANMSHEIRTPLNGVIGMASLLDQSELDGEGRHHVEVIRNCGESLLATINDILDFSKLDAGKVALEELPFRAHDVIERTAMIIDQQAVQKGLKIKMYSPILSYQQVGDQLRLQQVLLNLLSNAVKFSADGVISAGYRVVSETEASTRLRFEVSDSGIGLSEEARSRLFTPFTQADATTTRRYGGTGLGLSICKKLIEQMGGEIGVESVAGEGSTFFFEVPFRNSHCAAAIPEEAPKNQVADPAKLRVLVAEDNRVNQEVARRLLKKIGITADLVENGAEAVEAAANSDYDIILMDMQMPVLDGLDATRQIRKLPLTKQPWIVALTANAMKQDQDQCKDAGMDDFLAKPVRLEGLRKVLGISPLAA